MESMWNLWNECWLGPQPIHCSMDIMDSIWNDHGVVMEWSIPYGVSGTYHFYDKSLAVACTVIYFLPSGFMI